MWFKWYGASRSWENQWFSSLPLLLRKSGLVWSSGHMQGRPVYGYFGTEGNTLKEIGVQYEMNLQVVQPGNGIIRPIISTPSATIRSLPRGIGENKSGDRLLKTSRLGHPAPCYTTGGSREYWETNSWSWTKNGAGQVLP